MITNETRPQNRWSAGWGVTFGLLIAVIVYIPAELKLQSALGVPDISPRPRPLSERLDDTPPSYWISWAISAFGLAAPGLMLLLFPRTRGVAVGYLVTALLVGGFLAAGWMTLDFGSPVPD
ncbi:hypothetical protein ACQPW1_21805 [Nocardia sp. CA-128927]|uniref:hypothetical protein n=1 Tax=Nocardia sp. CA-128927 TaxID=3239975 RepID=UPI003D98BA6D